MGKVEENGAEIFEKGIEILENFTDVENKTNVVRRGILTACKHFMDTGRRAWCL